LRFLAPSALSSESSPPDAGLPLPLRSVLRVSHPPDGFLLDKPARPCFVPERSWSSKPFRAFSSTGAVPPLGGLMPSCPSPVPRSPPDVCPRILQILRAAGCVRPLRVASRLCSPVRVRRDIPRWLDRRSARCSPGFRAPSGYSLTDLAHTCLHVAPPSSFGRRRSRHRRPKPTKTERRFPGSPESSQGRDWSCSAQHDGPSWGFPPHRLPPRFESRPVLAHGFTSGARTTLPLRGQSLFGR